MEEIGSGHRLINLSPSKIRKRIVAQGKIPAITSTRYAALCEVNTHPVPNLRPQRFNHAGRSMTGEIYLREAGILIVVNEMAIAPALLVILAAKICKVPKEPFNQIKETCVMCLESAGGVDLESLVKSGNKWKRRRANICTHRRVAPTIDPETILDAEPHG